MRIFAYLVLFVLFLPTFIFAYMFFKRFYYVKLLNNYRKKRSVKNVGFFTSLSNIRKTLFCILILILYVLLSPNIFALSTSLNYNDCPSSDNSLQLYEQGTNLLIIHINELVEVKDFNPFIEGHTPTNKLFYEFSVLENLDDNDVHSNKLLTNQPVSNFQWSESTCSNPNSEIATGRTYIAILKYREPNIEFQNSDPRLIKRDDYVIINIIDISSYDDTLDPFTQDMPVQSVINDYLILLE